MYEEFRTKDIELLKIIQNAKKFGIENLTNLDTLEILFTKKDLNIKQENLNLTTEIFGILEKIKEDSQLSKT